MLFLKNKDKQKLQIIAVRGGERGLGATHISLCIANSLSLSGKRVAIIEWNSHRSFMEIEKAFNGFGYESRSDNIFRIRRLDYYKNYQEKGLVGIKKENYDYIVADLGTNQNPYFAEADCPILLVSGSEWRATKLLPEIKREEDHIGHRLQVCVNLGNQEEVKFFQKQSQARVYAFPYWKDAFASKKDQRDWICQTIF